MYSNSRRSGCPVSLSLEVFGDRWSLLIVRDLMVRGEQAAHAAGLRQATLDYRGLARALAIEGVAVERAGDKIAAADLFLRAGRSAAAQGDKTSARDWLRRAMSLAPGRLVGRDAADLLRGIDKSDH